MILPADILKVESDCSIQLLKVGHTSRFRFETNHSNDNSTIYYNVDKNTSDTQKANNNCHYQANDDKLEVDNTEGMDEEVDGECMIALEEVNILEMNSDLSSEIKIQELEDRNVDFRREEMNPETSVSKLVTNEAKKYLL